jgi:signal transduction histidine kinase
MCQGEEKSTPLGRMALRTTLLLYVVVPVALILVVAGIVGLHVLETQIERRMQEDVELVSRAIQPALSRSLERDRRGAIDRTLEVAFSIDRVFGAYVYDATGALLARAGPGGTLPSRRQMSHLAREADQIGEYGEVAGRRVYSYFVPLTDSGARIIGVLHVTRRASDFQTYISLLRKQAASLALVVLCSVTGLVLYAHHGAIGRHLTRIVESMGEVEAGNRRHRALGEGPKEIAHLAASMNSMLNSIERAELEVDEQRAAQLKLLEKLRQSEKLAVIGQLAAGVAHELGSPLSIITGKVERALRNDMPERTRREIRAIRRAVKRMERIVEQLLDFGRGHTLQLRSVRADRLARSAVRASVAGEACRGTSIEIQGREPAPELVVDPFRFEQALTNLLNNAVQAAGPRGRVRVSWFSSSEEIGYSVEDSGPGIAEDARERLFEPFFTTKKPGEGTGLGLALVHHIVEDHDGSIRVEKSSFGGARIRIVVSRPQPYVSH